MYKNILIPMVFDHGDQSTKAIAVADALLAESGSITLVHVVEDPPSYVNTYLPEGLSTKHHENARKELRAAAKASSAACEIAVVHGHASSAILEYAEKHGVDCIVIVSHKPGIEDYFLGSTAARVVRHAKCCVHVLR